MFHCLPNIYICPSITVLYSRSWQKTRSYGPHGMKRFLFLKFSFRTLETKIISSRLFSNNSLYSGIYEILLFFPSNFLQLSKCLLSSIYDSAHEIQRLLLYFHGKLPCKSMSSVLHVKIYFLSSQDRSHSVSFKYSCMSKLLYFMFLPLALSEDLFFFFK